MLIQEAKRLQKLAGIKEEQGHYYTSTDDPKTVQLHLTTDEKPSLSKNYKPLSPKSQRKDELTPEAIEKALTSALRNNKMDYEKSITVVSDKFNIDKDNLKKDFPKNDMLYKSSIDEVVNEALRKFRITEAEEAKVEQNVEDGLEKLLQSMKSAEQNIKPSPQDGQLDEIALTLAALITGAPGLLSFLGKGVDWLANHYSLEKVDHTAVGNALQKAGHKLEHQYIDSIAGWLQASGKYKGQDPHDVKSDLHDKAHGIYAAMLTGAAIVSGVEATHAAGLIAKGLEGGAAALKTSEVVSLAQKIASA